MLAKLIRYLKQVRSLQRINMALSRGGAAGVLRDLDPRKPLSWEFSGFSQNGEDGLLDFLTRRIIKPNRYFIEIGASDGIENNTAWLAIARRFNGIWIEGDPTVSEWCKYLFTSLNYGVESLNMFVTRESAGELKKLALYQDPDVFSLDIDGNDYYVAEAVLASGLKPKIFIVEYNSAFGPEKCVTIPYREDFRILRDSGENLYYGCSIGAWKKLFARHGYSFVTADSNGVNALFLNPAEFDAGFVRELKGLDFAENFSQLREYRTAWQGQLALLRGRELVELK